MKQDPVIRMNLPLRNSRIRLPLGQVFWREVGRGPILVFLHGSWRDGSQWLPLIDHLSQDYHCFALDLLGFGESERPKIHYSIQLQVECLDEYLKALHVPEVYLIGHSLGGWIAASYALNYLDRVRGLVLVSPEGIQADGTSRKLAVGAMVGREAADRLWYFAIAPASSTAVRSPQIH
jgi:Predicted hydrolases or acyltransferases (alpha/beta hydrolase superfamily)